MNHQDTETQRSELNELSHRVIGLCHAQLLTYLKLERRSLGLLINFNVPVRQRGIKRVVAGDLFKDEQPTHPDLGPLASLLCASVSLWLKTRI